MNICINDFDGEVEVSFFAKRKEDRDMISYIFKEFGEYCVCDKQEDELKLIIKPKGKKRKYESNKIGKEIGTCISVIAEDDI